MENVFKGNCRAEDFGGRESRAHGLKRPATSLARFSAITRRQSGSRSCQCGLVVHRTNGRGASACGSTRTVSGSAVAHNTQRPNAAPELLDVRHARRQHLSGKRQTRDERSCQLVSLRSRTRGRYFGGERASGRFYSEIRRYAQSSCSAPASGQRPYSPCCTRCLRRRRVVRSGGSTERVTAPSTRSQKSHADSCKPSRTAEATLSTASPIQGMNAGVDYDSVGHVDTPLLDRLGVTRDADFYLCGPPSFLRDLTAGLKTWGADSTRIHTEVFGPEAPITPGIAQSSHPPVHAPAGEPGTGPQISFTRSGLTVPWDSRFSSLLEFAEACDVPVQWSCRTGVCHTCECALIGGTVQYQPDPLEPPAAGQHVDLLFDAIWRCRS